MSYLKVLLLAFQVVFLTPDALEKSTALVVIVFLVMLALHHLLVSFTELFLVLYKRKSI